MSCVPFECVEGKTRHIGVGSPSNQKHPCFEGTWRLASVYNSPYHVWNTFFFAQNSSVLIVNK